MTVKTTVDGRGDCWQRVEYVLGLRPEQRCGNVLLHGPYATGKSHAAKCLGITPGEIVHVVGMTEYTTAAELKGYFVHGRDGSQLMLGPLLLAWEQGARLVLEEIDQAGNDSLACLIVGLDEVALAMLTGPDGVVRRPDSRFHCVATMNAAPESLSQALLERFRYIIHIDRPKEAIFERLSPALREPARKTCMLTDPARRISLRDWLGVQHIWDLEVRLGASRKDALAIALWAVLGPRADDVLVALRLGDIV